VGLLVVAVFPRLILNASEGVRRATTFNIVVPGMEDPAAVRRIQVPGWLAEIRVNRHPQTYAPHRRLQ